MNSIGNPALSNTISHLNGVEFTGRLVPTLITMIFMISGITAIIFLLIGGVKWITSGGDRESLAQAQKTLTSAIIGLVITLGAYALIRLIEYVFGITLTTIDIAPLIL